jgi:hypothetical protein
MAKNQGIDHKAATAARIKRTEAYAEKVRLLFAQTVNEILALNKTMPKLDDGVMFSFDGESMKRQKEVEALLRRLHSSVTMAIQQGVNLEWAQANAEADKLIKSVFGQKVLDSPEFTAWTQRNNAARDAFLARSEKGLNLSDRVWKSVRQLRDEMEVAITVSVGEGKSASAMSRDVRQYLNDPDLMFRRFRYKKGEDAEGNPIYGRKWKKRVKDEATGKYKWIDYDRDSYPTGQGVYKSSAKNAMRLTRTETNIAYRRADHERWQQMDFVLGQRVQLSKNHPRKDICDKLQGDYPKEFVFDGWHPQCFCFVTPILVDEEEMAKVNEAFLKGEKYIPKGKKITEYPDNFKEWVTSHAEDIADARDRGTEPYFIRNNAGVIDEILNPQPKELSIAEKAALRHAARTSEQEDAIRRAWAERNHQREVIKKGAGNVLKVAQDWPEVDYADLQAAIDSGDYMRMKAASKAVAQSIVAMRNEEKALSSLIPNVHDLHHSYSLNELQEAFRELDGVMNKWLSKYGYSSIDNAPLAHLRNKLDFELTSPTISYKHKDIVQKAINEKIRVVNQKIEWDNLVAKAATLKSFKTKSSIFKDCLTKINDAIKRNDLAALQNSIAEAENQQMKLIDKQIKRGGDIKSALNKEYKGGAIGKDITASVDTATMVSEDPYGGTFTNNVARLQGFDAPAKLVSEQEFDTLSKACGDVFYRTVNPTKFKGKNMTSEEFASQLYVADLLELNGPGGRVYGDGMYVATASWDGGSLHPLTDSLKRTAYQDSICYGRGRHTISEMTWTRKPKIIKQSELYRIWRKLSRAEQMRFDNNENTYACALGYDGMYCDGVNYMVIWNRSIIAVKKR